MEGKLSCVTFVEADKDILVEKFCSILRDFKPDVIHIWGTEYPHQWAMMTACEKVGMAEKAVIYIQGLVSIYARHYMEGLPFWVRYGCSFRDFVRHNQVVRAGQRIFIKRGRLEVEAIRKTGHIMGRTEWDRACTEQINPNAAYHYCGETLRKEFYDGEWSYKNCDPHSIFSSSSFYPVKGFHYLLEAMSILKRKYPDVHVTVPGSEVFARGIRRTTYESYLRNLILRYGLKDQVKFAGYLSTAEMKEQYLKANVFAMPSTIENSPNSLGEAMLLGVPCVAADVGGIAELLKHREEGFVYPSTEPYMLAHYITKVFEDGERAEAYSHKAREHARRTHDSVANLRYLLGAYREIAGLALRGSV